MENFYLTKTNQIKIIFCSLLFGLIITLPGFSQNVGINSTGNPPNASAGLDVDFSNMGLLIPRVSLTSSSSFAPLSAHVAGMVVYNTATVPGDLVPGFYYDNGTKWIAGFPFGNSIGDMLYWTGTAWSILPVGTVGQYLMLNASNIPYWATVNAGVYATITTNAATLITGTTATSGAVIVSDGGSAILSRGICYATTTGPTTANSTVIASPSNGSTPYSCNLTGLAPGTVYYVRAYTINNSTVSYGNEITFTTLAVVPTLAATTAATNITTTSATSGGNVTSGGGATITERGIYYGTVSNPTSANSSVVDPSPGIGAFVSNITGLLGGYTYYVRSYAINSAGTGYGAQISFLTLPSVTSTTAATSITATSASTGGVLAAFQTLYNVYYYGVAYSTTSNAPSPTKVQTGSYPAITGLTFVTNLTGLASNTLYYIRAYATTSSGATAYGPELTFTTLPPTAPVVTSTTAITSITASGAISGGTITSDGGSAITAKGVCWGTSTGPTVGVGNFTSNGTGTSGYASIITGLAGSTTYYVRAYATNSVGTSYGNELTFTTCGTPIYTIGQNVGGGIVFYVDCTGQHGLIGSTADQGSAPWGCNTVLIGTSAAYGTGSANTTAILAGCATRPICASLASSYAGGGFSDWYLPSSAELSLMMSQQSLFGFGQAVLYASSSENGVNNVTIMYWNGSIVVNTASVKTGNLQVRAIRSF